MHAEGELWFIEVEYKCFNEQMLCIFVYFDYFVQDNWSTCSDCIGTYSWATEVELTVWYILRHNYS